MINSSGICWEKNLCMYAYVSCTSSVKKKNSCRIQKGNSTQFIFLVYAVLIFRDCVYFCLPSLQKRFQILVYLLQGHTFKSKFNETTVQLFKCQFSSAFSAKRLWIGCFVPHLMSGIYSRCLLVDWSAKVVQLLIWSGTLDLTQWQCLVRR